MEVKQLSTTYHKSTEEFLFEQFTVFQQAPIVYLSNVVTHTQRAKCYELLLQSGLRFVKHQRLVAMYICASHKVLANPWIKACNSYIWDQSATESSNESYFRTGRGTIRRPKQCRIVRDDQWKGRILVLSPTAALEQIERYFQENKDIVQKVNYSDTVPRKLKNGTRVLFKQTDALDDLTCELVLQKATAKLVFEFFEPIMNPFLCKIVCRYYSN